nr:profilin isoform X1 [Bactrocera oleae]XP_036229890.1 profilin isoform X1 [Bactrocera oleae]XP_036229891.1 profilin isoform X1 [Bactrocera oleae]
MSWQDYVDNQLLASHCVTKACIAGHDGNIWAQSKGFEVTKEELAKLIAGFDQQDLLTSNGVTLAGQRYIYLSGTDRVVRAKLGRSGVHCMKTTQGLNFTKISTFQKKLYIQIKPLLILWKFATYYIFRIKKEKKYVIHNILKLYCF